MVQYSLIIVILTFPAQKFFWSQYISISLLWYLHFFKEERISLFYES